MRKFMVFTLAGLVMGTAANASLIGDEVGASLSQGETGNNQFARPTTTTDLVTATVGAGVEFTGGLSGSFTLDLSDSSAVFAIENGGDLAVIYAPGILLRVEDLDWIGEPGMLTGLTNFGGTLAPSVSGFSTTVDSFLIEFGQIGIGANTTATLTFDLVASHGVIEPVPEPATAALVLVGVAGMALRARRTRVQ